MKRFPRAMSLFVVNCLLSFLPEEENNAPQCLAPASVFESENEVKEAVRWMLRQISYERRNPKEHAVLCKALDNYILAKGKVKVDVAFIRYLRALKGRWVPVPSGGKRSTTIDAARVERLISEYVFHNLHGGPAPAGVLDRLFGEKNLLEMFQRKFVARQEGLEDAAVFLEERRMASSIEEYLHFSSVFKKAARRIEEGLVMGEEEWKTVRKLRSSDSIDLSPSVTPETLYEFLKRECDNKNIFTHENADDFLFLCCEVMRRLKVRRLSVNETAHGILSPFYMPAHYESMKKMVGNLISGYGNFPDIVKIKVKRAQALLFLHSLGVDGMKGGRSMAVDPFYLPGSYLRGVDFTRVPLLFNVYINFSGADLRDARFGGLNLLRVEFDERTNLEGAILQCCHLHKSQREFIPADKRRGLHFWDFLPGGRSSEYAEVSL